MDRDRQKHDGAPLSIKPTYSKGLSLPFFGFVPALILLLCGALILIGSNAYYTSRELSYTVNEVRELREELLRVSEEATQIHSASIQWFKLGEIDEEGNFAARNISYNNSIDQAILEMVAGKNYEYVFTDLPVVTIITMLHVRKTPEVARNKLPFLLHRGSRVSISELKVTSNWVWAKATPPEG